MIESVLFMYKTLVVYISAALYTAKVYRDLQVNCREIVLQGFRNYKDILGTKLAVIFAVILDEINRES